MATRAPVPADDFWFMLYLPASSSFVTFLILRVDDGTCFVNRELRGWGWRTGEGFILGLWGVVGFGVRYYMKGTCTLFGYTYISSAPLYGKAESDIRVAEKCELINYLNNFWIFFTCLFTCIIRYSEFFSSWR